MDIDGISLTVAGVDDTAGTFSVSTIPHANAVTTLSDRRVGDMVNLEIASRVEGARRTRRLPL